MILEDDDKRAVSIQSAESGVEYEFSMGRVNMKISSRGTAPVEESKFRVTLEFTGPATGENGVAVKDMRLLLSAPQTSAKIDKVYAGNHSQSREVDGADVTVSFGDLGYRKCKVIVDLILPAVTGGRCRVVGRVLKIGYAYRNQEGKLVLANPTYTTAIRGSIVKKKSKKVPQATTKEQDIKSPNDESKKVGQLQAPTEEHDIKSPNDEKKQDSAALSGMPSDIHRDPPVVVVVSPSEYQISTPSDLPPKAPDHQSSPNVFPVETSQDSQSSTKGGDGNFDKNYPEKPLPGREPGADTSPENGPRNYKKLIILIICLLCMTIYSSTREFSVVNLSFVSPLNQLKHTLSLFYTPPFGTYHKPDISSREELKEQPASPNDDSDSSFGSPTTPRETDISSREELKEQPASPNDDSDSSFGSPTTPHEPDIYVRNHLAQNLPNTLRSWMRWFLTISTGELLKEPPASPNDDSDSSFCSPTTPCEPDISSGELKEPPASPNDDSNSSFGSPTTPREPDISSGEELKEPPASPDDDGYSSFGFPTHHGHYTHLSLFLVVTVLAFSSIIYYSRIESLILNMFTAISTTLAYLRHATGGLHYRLKKSGLLFKFPMDVKQKFSINSLSHSLGRQQQLFSVMFLIVAIIMCYSIRWTVLLKMLLIPLAIAFTFVTVVGFWKLVAVIILKLYRKNRSTGEEEVEQEIVVVSPGNMIRGLKYYTGKLHLFFNYIKNAYLEQAFLVDRLSASTRGLSYNWKNLGLSLVVIVLILTLLIYYSTIWSALLKMLLAIAFVTLAIVTWFWKGDVSNMVTTINQKVFHKLNTLRNAEIIKQLTVTVTRALKYILEKLTSFFSTTKDAYLKQVNSMDMHEIQPVEASLDDPHIATGDDTDEQISVPISEIDNKLSSTAETNVKQELINLTIGGLSYLKEKLHLSFNIAAYFKQSIDNFKKMLVVDPLSPASGGVGFFKEMLILFSATMLSVFALIICYSIRWSEVFKMFLKAQPITILTFFIVVMFRKYSIAARTFSRKQENTEFIR